MTDTSKLNPHRLPRDSVSKVLIVLGVALAAGVYYWPGIKLGVVDLIQQTARVQEQLASANYTLYKQLYEQQWVKQILVERDWLVRNWLILGGLIGVVVPVIVFLVTYGSYWWRLLLPPGRSRDSRIIRLIQHKVLQAHWRTNWFNLEQAVLNVLLLGLSCFSLQLIIHFYILSSRSLVRAGLLSFLGFSYACFFFYMYIKRYTLRQAAGMLDDRLRLKQELVTSLDVQSFKPSRLGHFLLTDTVNKIKYKSVPQLFPYPSHRIKASHFFLQLGLVLLVSLFTSLGNSQLGSPDKGANSPIQMEELISQQAQQIRALSLELEQHLPSPRLPGVVTELNQLAQELLILGNQPGDVGIVEADAGHSYQGAFMPQGNMLTVSGIGASFTPPLVVEEAGSGASAGIVISPEEMRSLMASFSLPPSDSSQPKEVGRGLSHISGSLAQIAQQLSGLRVIDPNGGESPVTAEDSADAGQGGMGAKEADGDGSSSSTMAEKLTQLTQKLKQAQLPTSAQAIKHNLWLKGEQLAQLVQRLSQWEAAAAEAATEEKTGEAADQTPLADLGKQRFEIRMVSFKLSQSAQRLREWDAMIWGAQNQQQRIQLVPYSGQHGPGEASIISGNREDVSPPELNPQPRLRIGGESAPHSHAQVTNMSLDNSYQGVIPENQQSRIAAIARGYNQGSSSRPAQVKLGQGQREEPLGEKIQTTPHSVGSQQQGLGDEQVNQDGDNQQMAAANPADQDRAWEQWGRELQLASLSLADLADKGLMANSDGLGNGEPTYQPRTEVEVLKRLGKQLGQLSARLYNQSNSSLDYTASADEGLAQGLRDYQGDEPGTTQELDRLQNQALGQLAEQLGNLSQSLLRATEAHQQSATRDRYEMLRNLSQDLGLISQGLAELNQLSPQNSLELQPTQWEPTKREPTQWEGLEDREPVGQVGDVVEEAGGGSRLLPDGSGLDDEQMDGDVGQIGDRQTARKTQTNLKQAAEELDWLSGELLQLARDKRERRLFARRRLKLLNYQGNGPDGLPTNQAVDSQNGDLSQGDLSQGDLSPSDNLPEESLPLNLKLKTELQEVANELEKLAENRDGTEGRLEPEAIIKNGIQKITQASDELKNQAEPTEREPKEWEPTMWEPSSQLDKITDGLDHLAQELSSLQSSPSTFPSHLEGGTLPAAIEQVSSLQMPTYQTDKGGNLPQAQDGNTSMQDYAAALSQSQSYPQDRVKQQLALRKLDELIGKLRQAQAASDNASSRKGRSGGINQQQTDFSNGVDQQNDPQGGSELERSPLEGVISGPYPMEQDLTQDKVFERIIHRLEESRNRIVRFSVPSSPLSHNSSGQFSSRRGDLPQPDLPEVRGLTQWEQQQGVLRRKIAKPPSRFPVNKLISFRDPQEVGKYAKVSTRTQVVSINSYNHQANPGVPRPQFGQLNLSVDQDTDNSVRQQFIPQRYQQIIRQIYQPDHLFYVP